MSLPYINIALNPKTSITVLLDCASSVNFVTKSALDLLPHELGSYIATAIKTLRGISNEKLQQAKITVTPLKDTVPESLGQEFEFQCLILDKITSTRNPFQPDQLPSTESPDDFNLSPPNTKIDLLLGCVDFFKIFITHRTISPDVFIIKTKLGTTLAGNNSGKLIKSDLLKHIENHSVTNDQLDSLIKRYWTFERLPGDEVLNLTTDEYNAIEHLKKHTTYDPVAKRFTVRHIFKEEPQILNNVKQARGQWNSIENKLLKDPTNAKLYADHFSEGLANGIFAEVTGDEKTEALDPSTKGVHWLIHFPVLRPGHPSTPCRPVFSPSAPTPSPDITGPGIPDTSPSTGSKKHHQKGRNFTPGSKEHLQKGKNFIQRRKGRTLNDHILIGPNYLNSIPILTLAFRTGKYVVMADVKRQFHQLLIHPDDQRWGYFFYRDLLDANAELKVYKIIRTYFGLRCAPAQAGFCMRKIAEMQKEKYPKDKLLQEAVSLLWESNYADDYLFSLDCEKYGIDIVAKMQAILGEGSFSLCKFVSNSQAILQSIPEHLRAPLNTKEMKASQDNELPLSDDSKVLGLTYSATKDAFILEYSDFKSLMNQNKNTRRTMLQILATLAYDVLGARTPFVLKGRVLLQLSYLGYEKEVKEKGLDGKIITKKQTIPYKWDEPFREPLLSKWQEYVSLIPQLQGFQLPRYLPLIYPYKIVVMSDASNTCVAAAAWLVWEEPNSKKKIKYESRLIMCRGKVRALKDKNSIAKAELDGVILAREIILCIKNAFKCNFNVFHLFTDSMCVFHWMKMDSSRLGVYQKNRVEKIQELPIAVRYICSEMNGADRIAKTDDPAYLKTDDFIRGLPWIRQSSDKYPNDGPILANELHKMSPTERKIYLDGFRSQHISVNLNESHVTNVIAPVVMDDNIFFDVMKQHSDIKIVLLRIALIYRFIHRCKAKGFKLAHAGDQLTEKHYGPTLGELKRKAILFLIRLTQQRYFPESLKALKKNEAVAKGDPLYRLIPFLCEQKESAGIIRINTRLTYSRIKSYNTVYPFVLPSSGPLTKLLVYNSHHNFYHATELFMKRHLRSEFWIIRMEKLVRTVVKNCIPCNKINSREVTTLEAPLTADRVNLQNTYPLQTLHIDVFGHFEVRNQFNPTMQPKKVWILAGICVTTNFLVAMPVYSLDLDSMLVALQTLQNTYCSRVRKIQSDNAKTFQAGSKEVAKFFVENRDKLETMASDLNIEWHFSPTYSAWHNGLIERGGGLLKKALLTSMGKNILGHLDFENLLTACCCMCNQRPLLPIINERAAEILTPAQLVFGDFACHFLPDISESTSRQDMAGRWRTRKEIYHQFQLTWFNHYLDFISKRGKWHEFRKSLKVGDIVLVKMPSPKKKREYPLALITKIYAGKDGIERMCELRYGNVIELNKKIKRQAGKNWNWKQGLGFTKKPKVESAPIQRLFPLEGVRNVPLLEDTTENLTDNSVDNPADDPIEDTIAKDNNNNSTDMQEALFVHISKLPLWQRKIPMAKTFPY